MVSQYKRWVDLEIEDWSEDLMLAIFAHDIVYDVSSSTNEEDSAGVVYDYLKQTDKKQAWNVGSLVMSTKEHLVGNSHQEDLLIDLDLWGLGSSSDLYNLNGAGIRYEYTNFSNITLEQYNKGRINWLTRFLDRGRIYSERNTNTRREIEARRNMKNELRNLVH